MLKVKCGSVKVQIHIDVQFVKHKYKQLVLSGKKIDFWFILRKSHIFQQSSRKQINKYWNSIKSCSCCKHSNIKRRKRRRDGGGREPALSLPPVYLAQMSNCWFLWSFGDTESKFWVMDSFCAHFNYLRIILSALLVADTHCSPMLFDTRQDHFLSKKKEKKKTEKQSEGRNCAFPLVPSFLL